MSGTSSTHRPVVYDLLVVAGGLVTTLLTLVAVYWLAAKDSDFEIMGWYALLVIPAGAMLVGLASGSGYGLLSWKTGRKIGGGLLVVVGVLLVGAYGGAQWLEFASYGLADDSGRAVGFFEYYDLVTRSMRLTLSRSDSPTGELGALGYIFRLLELCGFVGGGLIAPLALRSKPYCEACSTYMRSHSLGLIPAAAKTRKIKKGDTAAMASYEAEMRSAFDEGTAAANELMRAVEAADASRVNAVLDRYRTDKKATVRLLRRLEIVLSACPRCWNGFVSCKLHTGQGDKTSVEEVARQPASSTLSRMLT